MKVWKKVSALALSLMLVLALCAPAFATVLADSTSLDTGATTGGSTEKKLGQQGTFDSTTPDNPTEQDKTLTLAKEITAYNPYRKVAETDADTITIKAPTISYTYTIAAATVEENSTTYELTDNASKHATGVGAVTVPVKAGVTPTAVIVAENKENNAGTGNGTVAWTSNEDLQANSTGVPNYKPITFDFSNIDFTDGAGVYRYVVTETLTTGVTDNTYEGTGVTETSTQDTANAVVNAKHIRYIDVYVMDTPDDNDAETPAPTGTAKWTIYGFTCFYKNQTFTDETKNTVGKTTGFVTGKTDATNEVYADKYYTYNLTVSKTVVNDSHAATNHEFLFTVIFTNSDIKKDVGIITSIGQVDSTDTTHTATANDFVGTNSVISGLFTGTNVFQGVLKIKHNTKVEYIGIPCGTDVEVYETNDVSGVTYKVDTSVDKGAATTDNAVISTTTTPSAITQAMTNTEKTNTYESTKATITTTADKLESVVDHSIAITNTLLNISPTGVTLRYAPYLAMMGAGIVALPLSLRKKEEELY